MSCRCFAILLRDWSDMLVAWGTRWLLQVLGVCVGVFTAIYLTGLISWKWSCR